jgi:predicted negative regulator of RcsB-dependent stress response
VARITRKELKTDRFALEVGQTVSFFEEHEKEIIRYGGIVVAVVALIVAYSVYSRHQRAAREEALAQAILLQEAPIGGISATGGPTFPTQAAKDAATTKAFTDVATRYSGSEEAQISQYYLGSIKADDGDMAGAEKQLLEVSQHGNDRYSSLAKLSLAQVYFGSGKDAQGEAVLRDLMAHPTLFVSKDQAAIALARYLMLKNPAEARKLLDPIKLQSGPVGQLALTLSGQIPAQ